MEAAHCQWILLVLVKGGRDCKTPWKAIYIYIYVIICIPGI